MRPVMRGMYQMESLTNGNIDLEMVALANDAIDVQDENERRWRAHQERNNERSR